MRTAARVGGPGKGKEIGNQLLYYVAPGSYPTRLRAPLQSLLFHDSCYLIIIITSTRPDPRGRSV
jgi:hypothetical protein